MSVLDLDDEAVTEERIFILEFDQCVSPACLVSAPDFGDVKYALTRLLERGYFYEVEDELRVTSLEEQCSVLHKAG